jgi:hypothetical protein
MAWGDGATWRKGYDPTTGTQWNERHIPQKTDYSNAKDAPEGMEWVLLPERPGGAPGELGQYSELSPQPIQVFEAWELSGLEFSAFKYLARYKRKGGIEDLEKANFYIDRLIARERRLSA